MIGEKLSESTLKFLRECDAGVKMAIRSLDEVLDTVQNIQLKKLLKDSKKEHEKIESEIIRLLSKINKDEKEPSPMAKAMSWTKINFKIMMDKSDKTISDIISEGCEMGVKTLEKLKNEYNKANKEVLDIADRIILLENELKARLKGYL